MKRVRWFLAEFFVVVSGVVVAFALNSWWQEVNNDKKEKQYIAQISRELDSTLLSIENDIEYLKGSTEASASLLTYAYAKELPPETEMVNNMMRSLSFNTSGQVSGTLQSLINSGDIQLIKDDELRTTLITLEKELRHFDQQAWGVGYEKVWPSLLNVMKRVDMFDLVLYYSPPEALAKMAADSLTPIRDTANIADLSQPDFKEIFSQKGMRDEASELYVALSNLLNIHKTMKDGLERVQGKLEGSED